MQEESYVTVRPRGGWTIFDALSDAALLEEALVRLGGVEGVAKALGDKNTNNVYTRRNRKGLSPDARAKLVEALYARLDLSDALKMVECAPRLEQLLDDARQRLARLRPEPPEDRPERLRPRRQA